MLCLTKETAKKNIEDLHRLITDSKKIILVSGARPDADLVGSLVAFWHYCRHLGKEVTCFNKEEIPPNLFFMSLPEFTANSDLLHSTTDTVVTFDIGDLKDTGLENWLMDKCPQIINIDHHPSNTRFGTLNVVIPEAAATTELIFNLFKITNLPITKEAATAMLAGLMTDTGNLSNPATSGTALAMAAELMKIGGQFKTIIDRTYKNKTLATLKLWGKVIDRLHHNPRFKIATVIISHQDLEDNKASQPEDLEGLPNFLTILSDAQAILVLKEYEPGKIKGSFRTTRDHIDLSFLAGAMGGGGHKKAAGFTICGNLAKTADSWYIN